MAHGRPRGRLSPDEVKQSMQADQPATSEAPFHNPFAAALADVDMEKLVPKKRTAVQRLRERAEARAASPDKSQKNEPSLLAQVRAQNKAARQALAEQVAPIRRPKRSDDPK